MSDCKKISIQSISKHFLQNHKKEIGMYLSSLLNMPVKEILLPILLGALYNKVQEKNRKQILIYCIVLCCTVIVVNILDLFEKYCESILFPLLQSDVRNIVLKHIFENTSESFKEQESGVILAHIIRFPYTLYGFLHDFMKSYIPGILKGIFFIIYFFVLKWQLGVMATIVIVSYVLVCAITLQKCSKISVCRDNYINDIYKNIEDALTNIKTVLTYNNTEKELARINRSQSEYKETSIKTNMCSVKPRVYIVSMLFVFAAIIIVGFLKVIPLWDLHKLSKGTVLSVLVIIYSTYMIALLQTEDIKDTVFAYGPIKNTLEILNDCDKMRVLINHASNSQANKFDGIVLENVNFKYSNASDKVILDNINIHIKPNGITLILGEIGSGKSTLINLIMKYYIPQHGNIYIDGDNYATISAEEIRERVSYIPQTPLFFSRTLYENLVYGMEDTITRNNIYDKIDELGLNAFMTAFPDGLETNAGIRGSALSGGQKQMLSLLKMALLQPKYILLDEPTSAMDTKTVHLAKRIIKKLSEHSVVIIITHDKNISDIGNETYIISKGKSHKQNKV